MRGTFRSLASFNYRLWIFGTFISNVGGWMQRTAQDWLVLTQLSHNNATAVGVTTALQFLPQVLLLPLIGYAADHFDKRKLLLLTQSIQGSLAFGLGILTLTGLVQLWHVYVFAALLGCASSFDGPARQTFISELVIEDDIPNAVGLNSTSMNAARLIGPAVCGVLISAIGSSWVFMLNAGSFLAVIASLRLLRLGELRGRVRSSSTRGNLTEALRYIADRPDIKAVLLVLFVIGTFGLHYPILIATMSVTVFHVGASHFGVLLSIMAIGSIIGALLAAGRSRPGIAVLLVGSLIFGTGQVLAAVMPNYLLFGMALIVIGAASQTITTGAVSILQLTTDPQLRGRVMAIVLAVLVGGIPVGAPIVGWIADTFGPRWVAWVGAASGFAAALVAFHYLRRYRQLRVSVTGGRIRFSYESY
jgi:MFS family permease